MSDVVRQAVGRQASRLKGVTHAWVSADGRSFVFEGPTWTNRLADAAVTLAEKLQGDLSPDYEFLVLGRFRRRDPQGMRGWTMVYPPTRTERA